MKICKSRVPCTNALVKKTYLHFTIFILAIFEREDCRYVDVDCDEETNLTLLRDLEPMRPTSSSGSRTRSLPHIVQLFFNIR